MKWVFAVAILLALLLGTRYMNPYKVESGAELVSCVATTQMTGPSV